MGKNDIKRVGNAFSFPCPGNLERLESRGL